MKKSWLVSLILTWFLATVAASGSAQSVEECLMCHGDEGLTKEDSAGKEISLYVDESVFTESIHATLGCAGCHLGVEAEMHETPPEPVDCGICHAEALELYQAGYHWQRRLQGVAEAPTCRDCHGYHHIRGVHDAEDPAYRANEPDMCGKCHAELRLVSKYHVPAPSPFEAYVQSAHGKALRDGNLAAAVCTDCHTSHDMKAPFDPTSLAYRVNVPSTCGQCHPAEQEEYAQDAHGTGVKRGLIDSPVCTDCHSTHAIKSSSDETSSTFPANVSKFMCVYCHSREQVLEKYGYVTERVTPNLDRYHGVMSRAGDTTAASCASCHTSHNVRSETDPLSSIFKSNRPLTCGKCHQGAGPHFAQGSIHIVPTSRKDLGVWWVRRIYLVLIAMTIGGMLAHNGVIMIRYIREKYREAKSGRVIRWTEAEVLWHFLLFVSFVTLIVTGFAFRFPDAWWSSWMTSSPASFAARGVAHRVAGMVFIGLFVYALGRSVLTRRGRQQIMAKLPVPADSTSVIQNVLYSLGLSSSPPQFGRYDYSEKAEYWALMWGGFVMVMTGFPLWFETFFLGFVPKWLLDTARAIHYYEAWLATLAILVWHFFFMFLHPENYPINLTVLTGRMTEEEYMKKHPADYDRMIARGELGGEESEESGREEGESV